jgi:CheY-like chemotaxis protein/two-component sensor histidine kinase
LAAGIAHEINNPLAYVMVNLQFLADTMEAMDKATAEERRAALEEARGGCDRIRSIVRDVQLFSRELPDDTRKPVDLRRVLDSSANIVGNEIRARARLVRDYDHAPQVEGNEARLGQAIVNLLVNAAQAIPEGDALHHEVRLSARRDGDRVVIEVKDTGEGIPTEVRGRIFDPFFTTKPVGVGTGLGLSIVHRLVTGMGGDVTFESERGHGTTFRLRLRASAAPPATRSRTRVKSGRNGAARARILVVDDEEMIGVMLARVLSHAHDLEWTTRPDDAIRRVKDGERFDLILCDLMMPARSGADVHAAIAALAPEQASRMIFLTGGAFSARAQEFLATQKNPVVEKPFVVDDLLARIDEFLAAKRGASAVPV